MQQAMHYHRRHFRDVQVLPMGKVLEMVTIDAARALGMDDIIGSLEVGKKADIILVNLCAPHLAPTSVMPLEHVICYGNAADVDTVFIDGELLMRGRRVMSVDEYDVVKTATSEAQKAISRCKLGDLRRQRPGFWGKARYD